MDKTFIIFTAVYFPSSYGVERYTYNLARKLIEKGNKVKIITCNIFNLPLYEKQEDNIEIYRVPCINLLNGRFPVIKYSKEFRKLLKEHKKSGADLVIVNTRFYLSSLFGVIFAKKIKSKSIIIEHGTSHFSINSNFWDTLGGIYEHFITFLVKCFCKDFYGVSRACNNWLKHFKIEPKGTLYNAINLEDIKSIEVSSEDFQNKYDFKINEDDIVIAFVGRLIIEKGILKLVEAFNLVRQNNKNVKLIIAGDGLLLEKIKKIEDEDIKVLGKIPFEDVIRLLKLSSIYCLPTEYSEGFPTSLLEAAATRSFLIATDRGGSPELVQDESYGIILKDTEINTIKEAIEKAVNNNDYMQSAINKSHDEIIKNYQWDITTNKVIEIAGETKTCEVNKDESNNSCSRNGKQAW